MSSNTLISGHTSETLRGKGCLQVKKQSGMRTRKDA